MSQKRILLVDDEDDIREVAAISMQAIGGWDVCSASNGTEAIAQALTEQPDAILLDVMMPGIDGLATFKRLQDDARTRDIPVILLTAKPQAAARRSFDGLGVAGVLSKPFDPMTLPDQVAALLAAAGARRGQLVMASELGPAIEAIWQRSRVEIARRIATLEQAVVALRAGDLTDQQRMRAERDAHKLAGSLAMFGFATGSERARDIEQAVGSGDGCAGCDVHALARSVLTLRYEFELRLLHPGLADEVPGEATPPLEVEREILVIDDSALIRRIVQIGLGSERGWRVRVAASGAEGLELASHTRPDAILLTVEMPGLDGPATLARLRTDFEHDISVLFLTGHSTPQDRARLEALGAAGVIAKPFDPAGLAEEISRLLSWAP